MDIQAVAANGAPQQADPSTDGASASAVAPTPPAAAPAPAPTPNAGSAPDDHRQPLTTTVAQLFTGAKAPNAHPVQVSYRVEGSEIITVFTDPKTGKEIAQFPSEMMIQFAQFFAKESGVTLDRSA